MRARRSRARSCPSAYSLPRSRPARWGSLGIGFHLPGQELTAFVLLAVVTGIAAAVLPARRAARLRVLQALQYE